MVAVNSPDAFDHVERLAVWMPDAVNPSFAIEIHGVCNQRIYLPMPDRVSHPQRAEGRIVRSPVRKNLMANAVVLENHEDFPGRLNNLEWQRIKKNAREAHGNTGMEDGIIRFCKRNSIGSERGLGGFELRLGPRSHGRLVHGEFISPVAILNSNQPRMIVEPDA